MYTNEKIKWYTSSEYIDIDTGEIITRSAYERGHYRKLNTTSNTEIYENNNRKFGIKRYTTYIKQHEQIRLFE